MYNKYNLSTASGPVNSRFDRSDNQTLIYFKNQFYKQNLLTFCIFELQFVLCVFMFDVIQ